MVFLERSIGRNVPDAPRSRSLSLVLFPVNGDIAGRSILAVWTAYLSYGVVRILLAQPPFPAAFLMQHIILIGTAMVATWLIYRLLVMMSGGGIAVALIMLIIPAAIMAGLLTQISNIIINADAPLFDFSYVLRPESTTPMLWEHFLDKTLIHYLLIAGWGGFYLALAHNRTMHESIALSRQLERATRESELRALRYQLNPHFIFNALNSVSSLVIDRKNREAEDLVDGLADYMRVVLKDEQGQMVTLEQEIAQQVRYLEIEQARFPQRLRFSVDLAEEARSWKIPALLIQPLVENAVKHGVARSANPVTVAISAVVDDARLIISVANDGQMQLTGAKRGTGLQNIEDRLAAVYGSAAALRVGNSGDGMAVATIIVPDGTAAFQDI